MEEDGQIDQNHAQITLSMMEQFYVGEKYWDVQLQVDTKFFKCQRSMLAAHSEYFDTMFSSNFEESDVTRGEPIILQEMDATAFGEILHFMHTGEVRVNSDNILQLLFMSDFLRLRTAHVKEQCVKYVKNRAEQSDPWSIVVDLFSFACMKGDKILIDILSAHICQHLYRYSKGPKFVDITFENLMKLLKFSKSYNLPLLVSQNVILKIIHNWINHKREERSQYRCQLMENLNFSDPSSDFSLLLINKLENALDEIVKVSRDMPSLSELKTLKEGIDINLTGGDARLEAIISFNVSNVSKMELKKKLFSSSCMISNLSWKIGVVRYSNVNGDDLGVFLYCDGTSSSAVWSCYAKAVITLVSQKKGKESLFREVRYALYASYKNPCGWGFVSFLKWNDLKEGFIENDCMTLRTHVYADVPFSGTVNFAYISQ